MTVPRWQAPRRSGATLVTPSWEELPGLVEKNIRNLGASQCKLGRRGLTECRSLARAGLLEFAGRLHQALGLDPPSRLLSETAPIIGTGHQPELFHPGVWIKNFAVARLANRVQGLGINLAVDSDMVKTANLQFPVAAEHVMEEISFSSSTLPLIFEEWNCEDEAAYASLPERSEAITRSWPWTPTLKVFWEASCALPSAEPASAGAGSRHPSGPCVTKRIGERWLIGRHRLERAWQAGNVETTVGRFCDTAFFGLLLGWFVQRREEFAAIFNEELELFRDEQGITSRNHPAANLELRGDDAELPFWAWREGDRVRGRLMAGRVGTGVKFSVLAADRQERIPESWPADAEAFLRAWPGLRQSGWKIRPKALVTSMMMRLFVTDLFIHGIGGAVYDALTDRIFSRFWGTELPRFAVVTATLRLPWNEDPADDAAVTALRQRLRSLHWNPDKHLPEGAAPRAEEIRRAKQALIGSLGERPTSRDQFKLFREFNEALQPFVAPQWRELETALADLTQKRRRDAILFSREHPWVFYPEATLRELVQF